MMILTTSPRGFAMRPRLALLAVMLAAADVGAEPPKPMLPEGAVLRLGTDAFRAPAPIVSSAFSPDGKLLAIGTQGRLAPPFVVVFDAATGRPMHRFKGIRDSIRDLSFSPDGQYLATANADKSLALYDLAAGKLKWQLMDTATECVQFLRDGKTLAAGQGATVILADIADGKILRKFTGPTKTVQILRASDNGDLLAGASEGKHVTVWDVKSGDVKHTFAMPESYAVGLAFSPGGELLAASGGNGEHVVWSLKDGKQLWHAPPNRDRGGPPSTAEGGPLAFSADGKQIIGLCRSGRVFDAVTGKVLSTPRSGSGNQRGGVSADRKRYAPVFSDHIARVVDLAADEFLHPAEGHTEPPTAVVFAEGGKAVYTGTWEDMCRWDAMSGKLTARVDACAQMLVVSPDGTRMAGAHSAGETAWWQLPSLARTSVLRSPQRDPNAGVSLHSASDAFFLSRGGRVVPFPWGTPPADLKTYRSDQLNIDPYDVKGLSVCVTPDGRSAVIAEGGKDGPRLVWWDFTVGKVTRSTPNGRMATPAVGGRGRDATNTPAAPRAFLPDGRRFVAESEEGFLLIRGDTGERVRLLCAKGDLVAELQSPRGGHIAESVPFAVSPDGRLLAVGEDKGIHLVETATGEIRRTFQPGEIIRVLAFSPDGLRIASTGESCSALVWDVYAAATPETTGRSLTGTAAEAHSGLYAMRQQPTALLGLANALSPAKKADAARVTEWLKDLDAPKFAAREAAQAALAKLEADALSLIDAHLKTPGLSPEARTRAEKVRAVLLAATPSPEQRQTTRILELLELLNTPDARREMARLAAGEPGYALTVEATESLARMAKRAGK